MEKISQSNVKRIVITGPESTGKSTLARQLSNHFVQPWLEEYARSYLADLGRFYVESDLVEIAKGQAGIEDKAMAKHPSFLFLDTSIEVIKIWSEWKYGSCDAQINDLLTNQYNDFYLLLYPDIVWTGDPMRENPNDRIALFNKFESLLLAMECDFVVIRGNKRKESAITAIQELLSLDE